MRKVIFLLIFLFLVSIFFVKDINLTYAASYICKNGDLTSGTYPTLEECVSKCPPGFICQPLPSNTGGEVSLDNPLGETKDPSVLIGKVINAVLGVVGSLALLMFIYGGFTWMLAGGNSEAVTKGKNIIIWAVIGLVIIFTSYAVVKFVIYDAILGTA